MRAARSEVTTPGAACDAAGRAAETAARIPAGLLHAIGQVESGRPDAVSGTTEPWPWTLDLSGEGRFYASKYEALTALQQAVAAGVRSIDVGCFQVNLLYHPDAFPSLEAALDPVANANYAAAFLDSLRQRTGDWKTAVAWYHSAEALRGGLYRDAVEARWGGSPAAEPSDPFVLHIGRGSTAGFEPAVWTPFPSPVTSIPTLQRERAVSPERRRSHLPQVITPVPVR